MQFAEILDLKFIGNYVTSINLKEKQWVHSRIFFCVKSSGKIRLPWGICSSLLHQIGFEMFQVWKSLLVNFPEEKHPNIDLRYGLQLILLNYPLLLFYLMLLSGLFHCFAIFSKFVDSILLSACMSRSFKLYMMEKHSADLHIMFG